MLSTLTTTISPAKQMGRPRGVSAARLFPSGLADWLAGRMIDRWALGRCERPRVITREYLLICDRPLKRERQATKIHASLKHLATIRFSGEGHSGGRGRGRKRRKLRRNTEEEGLRYRYFKNRNAGLCGNCYCYCFTSNQILFSFFCRMSLEIFLSYFIFGESEVVGSELVRSEMVVSEIVGSVFGGTSLVGSGRVELFVQCK